MLRTADGKALPLSEVATMERANGQGELRRENLRPMAVVSGRLEGRDLGSAVADIRTRLAALKLPVGYTYEIGGQYQGQARAFQELLMVFGVAVGLAPHPRDRVPGLGAGHRHPGGGTAVAGRAQLLPLVADRHRFEHLLGDGSHPAWWAWS